MFKHLSTKQKALLLAMLTLVEVMLIGQTTTLRVGKLNNIRYCNDASFVGTTAGAKIKACIADLPSTGGTADARGIEGAQTWTVDPFNGKTNVTLILGAATHTSSVTIIIPTGSGIIGNGRASKIVSSSTVAPSGELIQLQGDYAFVKNFWLSGSGQVANTPDGKRGIWIGSTASPHVGTGNVNYARVEGMIIDQFTGNGISGDYTYATIVNNLILNTTDAGVFLQPTSTYNLVQGNTISGTRYSGIDVNGSNNRIIGNISANNGGGNADEASQNGILIDYVSGQAGSASNNIVTNNTLFSNKGCGIRTYNMATSGNQREPYGNIIKENNIYNQTIAYTDTTPTTTEWTGGVCILGGDANQIISNVSRGNVLNYVATGFPNVRASIGNIFHANTSIGAVANTALNGAGKANGVGYLFPGGTRIDGAGAPSGIAGTAIFTDNWDLFSVAEGFRWSLEGGAGSWDSWTITGNHSESAGTYGFSIVNLSSFIIHFFDWSNYAINASTANYNNFPTQITTAVNQGTDKTTTVIQNGALSGKINMHTGAGADSLNPCCVAASAVSFNITNNMFTTGRDFVIATQSGGPGTYYVKGEDNGANTIFINVQRLDSTAGNRDDAIIIDYHIIKR